MNNTEKGMIIAFFSVFRKVAIVARLVGRPWSTVRNFLDRAMERESMANLPCPGWPPKIPRSTRRLIIRAAKKNRNTTWQELRDAFAPDVSLSTVDRVLRDANIHKWIAKKRARLNAGYAKQRLAWALARRDWTAEDFEGILWSDKCTVERSRDPRQKWVFRTPSEKWHAECIKEVGKGKGISIMVWGCFWGKNKGTFCPIIVPSFDRWLYLMLLEYLVLPPLQRIQNTIGDPVFMQDNCRVHTADLVMEWFEEQNIQLDEHPPCSPDLNPIENAWVELKKRLQIMYPDIATMPGGPKKVRERLVQVLPEV